MAEGLGKDLITTTVLSWVAGYVDTAGFLSLNGLFTAHVTGNLVVAGAQLAGTGGEAVWVRLAVVPVFIAAIVLTTVIADYKNPRLSSFLGLETFTLLIFTAVSVKLVPFGKHPVDTLTMFVAGSTGVFAMGIQNTLMRHAFGNLAPTTVMTGNLTQFTMDFVRLRLTRNSPTIAHLNSQPQERQQRISKFSLALVGFIFGAAFGAFFTKIIGFWSLLLPTGAIAFLALYLKKYE